MAKDLTKNRKTATKINGVVAMDKVTALAWSKMLSQAIPHMTALWAADMTKEKRRYIESLELKLLDAKDIIGV